mgnify:CR=1 FL=1
MKHILVCVKAVPVSSSVEVDGQHRLKRDGASLQWNIADESALEAAFRLADRDGSVTVLTMGPPKLEGPLLELLARGANRAVLITDRLMAGADTRATARALASAAEKLGPFDAVFCGCKAIDGETGQVPGELAAALGLLGRWGGPLYLLATRRLEDGVQNLTVSGSAVISFSSYSYPLRLAGILGMRRARETPVEILTAADLGLTPEDCGLKGSLTKVVAMESRFPGLRRGPKETDLDAGVQNLRVLLREVRP